MDLTSWHSWRVLATCHANREENAPRPPSFAGKVAAAGVTNCGNSQDRRHTAASLERRAPQHRDRPGNVLWLSPSEEQSKGGLDRIPKESLAAKCLADVAEFRMTKPFLLRARPSVIAAMDARAARLGQDRTQYVLSLVARDLAQEKSPR